MIDPAGRLRRAGLGRRWVAALLDALIGLGALALCAMWLLLALWAIRGLSRDVLEALLLLGALLALGATLHVVYQVVFVGGCGQTPGQMALGIKVVRGHGARAGYGRALLRLLGGLLDALALWLPSAVLLLGPERRGLADRLAGTRVVLLRRAGAGDGSQGRLQRLEGGQPLVERGVAGQ